jgi:hypothetical protein
MRPILIVGAGRSGTNFIASALGASSTLKNAFEQRYVWSKGRVSMKSDLRNPESATRRVKEYIRNHFAIQAAENGGGVRIIDKTPGNALRIEFCLRVFPNAQIINVIRNPLDNVASRIVELQKAGLQVEDNSQETQSRQHLLRQRFGHARDLVARGNIPIDRIPSAFLDQALEHIRIAVLGGGSRYAERVPGFAQVAREQGYLIALCYQWRTIVMSAVRAGRKLPRAQYVELQFEHALREPAEVGDSLATFLDLADSTPIIDYLVTNADTSMIGKWRNRLTDEQKDEILSYLDCEMSYLGMRVPG